MGRKNHLEYFSNEKKNVTWEKYVKPERYYK